MKKSMTYDRPWRRKLTSGLNFAMIGCLSLALTACAGVLPGGGDPSSFYTLSPKSTFPDGLPKVNWQLVVENPATSGALSTQRIALTHDPVQIEYFGGARWTERAPQMVQTLLVESFENSNKIVAVGRQAIGLRSDFNLKSDLREFQAEYDVEGEPPMVRVRVNSKLIRQPKRQIVASRTFERKVRANSTSMRDVVKAFDEALGKVLKRIVEWTLLTAEQSNKS
jgi:cholesterol transport system auxiliary component